MIIRIIPPQSSARNFRAMPQPKRIPNSNPMRDIMKDTKPMIEMGASISEKSRIPRNAIQTFRVILFFAIFVFERLSDHASAQESKDDERNPMIQTFY